MVSVRRQSRTLKFHFVDRPEKPLTPFLRELDFPDLLPGVEDKRAGQANFHLVFDESAICESLDHVVGVKSTAGRRPARVLQLHGHSAVRGSHQAIQSGLPEMPRASQRSGSPKNGWPDW